jgi:hypothetical protein
VPVPTQDIGSGSNNFSGGALTFDGQTVLAPLSANVVGLIRLQEIFRDRFENN